MKSKKLKVFIAEDDPWYGSILLQHLSLYPDFIPTLYTSGKELLSNLFLLPDIVCVDFRMPDLNGKDIVKSIRVQNEDLPIVIISGQEEISVAVELLKAGATDYIVKNEYTREYLWRSLFQIRQNLKLREEVDHLRDQLGEKFNVGSGIRGQSEAIKRTFKPLQKAIDSNVNVLLSGETGTGKEVYAKAIHCNGARKKKPFVAVNMGAIPDELVESELFGHEKGAFTGAFETKQGKFEAAQGGTLFLDEIGELSLSAQSKLLRVLQEREITRVGGNKPLKVDIRLICATNKNLAEEVKKGNFREDLFYRIIGLPIVLPPLRERGNDILILAKFFLDDFNSRVGSEVSSLSEGAKEKLKKHSWPGNVRELKSVIELASVMAESKVITSEDISFPYSTSDSDYLNRPKTLKEHEIEIISHYMKEYNNNVVFVSQQLAISKTKIYDLLKKGQLLIT